MAKVSVNLRAMLAVLCLAVACGPAPRPVPPSPQVDEDGVLPSAPRVAWRNDIGSGLVAALHARGPALFATTTNRTVVALAKDTGRRYWLHRFNGAITTGAIAGDGRIYFATEDLRGVAHALETARGRRVWSRAIGAVRHTPLLLDKSVYFATDAGRLYALNAATGVVDWQREFSAGIAIPPLAAGNTLLTATTGDSVYALGRADGAIRNRAGLAATPSAPGSLQGDTLVLPLHNGTVVGLDASTLRQLFEVKLDAPVLAAPQLAHGSVYVLSRNAVLWRITGGSAERVSELEGAARGSLAEVGDQLVVGLLDGRVIALDGNGRKLWEHKLPRSVVAPALASGPALFVTMINGEVWKLQ